MLGRLVPVAALIGRMTLCKPLGGLGDPALAGSHNPRSLLQRQAPAGLANHFELRVEHWLQDLLRVLPKLFSLRLQLLLPCRLFRIH